MWWPEGLMCYVWDYVLCDICMLYDDIDRTGGSNELWPDQRVQRATGLEGPAETHRPEGRIIASSGVCVVCGILGNSLSNYAYSCCVMCFRYQWWAREGAGMIRTHTHWSLYIMILGFIWFVLWHDTLDLYALFWMEIHFKKWKFCFKIFVVTV